jgi:hypothetical protein
VGSVLLEVLAEGSCANNFVANKEKIADKRINFFI